MLILLVTKQHNNDVKEVIQESKFSIEFSSNTINILIKKDEFSGLKTNDCHTFIKVIIWVYYIFR